MRADVRELIQDIDVLQRTEPIEHDDFGRRCVETFDTVRNCLQNLGAEIKNFEARLERLEKAEPKP